jgi:hypothetical protein
VILWLDSKTTEKNIELNLKFSIAKNSMINKSGSTGIYA